MLTGASGGIGRVAVVGLADAGHLVFAAGRITPQPPIEGIMADSRRVENPKIVNAAEWQQGHDGMIRSEKEATRALEAYRPGRGQRLGVEQVERDCGDTVPSRMFGTRPCVVDLRVPLRRNASQLDEIESMLRLAIRPDGLNQVTAWIAQRGGGCAVVFDHDVRPLIASPMVPADLLPRIAGDLRRVALGEVSAEAVELGDWSARILPLAGSESGVLLLASRSSVPREVHSLARDAASLISLCLRLERSNQSQHRLEVAYDHNREAVIHLPLEALCRVGTSHAVLWLARSRGREQLRERSDRNSTTRSAYMSLNAPERPGEP